MSALIRLYVTAYFLSGLTYARGVTIDGNQVPTDLGTKDTHFYRTQYGYNQRGLPDKVVNDLGTITRIAYDALGRAVSTWIGLDDQDNNPGNGTIYWSPATAGDAEFDLVKVSETEYDNAGIGDSDPTKTIEYPGGSAAARNTFFYYDWRNRLVAAKYGDVSGASQVVYLDLDNLGRASATSRYDGSGVSIVDTTPADGVPDRPVSSKLRAYSQTSYDAQGRPYQARKYSVSQTSGGTPSANSLRTDLWFDRRGNVTKASEPGGLMHKYVYDGAGRLSRSFASDGGGDPAPGATDNWAHADDVVGDNVLEQTEYVYDLTRNAVLVTNRQRFHTETDLGDLTTAGIDDRASYSARYYDKADRLIYNVDYGTNGGTDVTAPDNINNWPSAALVMAVQYGADGNVSLTIDPAGIYTASYFDLLRRKTKMVENVSDLVPSNADDRTALYTYDGSDHLRTITAVLPDGSDSGTDPDLQMTEYVYSARKTAGSNINSNDLLTETRYPYPTGDSPGTSPADIRYNTYNQLGEVTTYKDQNGTIHAYTYDVLGRITLDDVTAFGSTSVDTRVVRQRYTYASGGQISVMASEDSLGSTVVQIAFTYNGLGDQATQTTQSFLTGGNGSVTYAYSFSPTGTANHSRLTSMTYPGGRVITYDYGTAGSLNDKISRVNALKDGTTTLEAYSYLGLGTVVVRDRPQPGTQLTYYQSGGSGDGGDAYVGLDRFGRVVDQRWTKGASDIDRFQYAYDRNSNRTSKDVTATGAPTNLDEAYFYDGLDRLTKVNRGTLSGGTITDAASVYQQTWTLDGLGNWSSFVTDSNGGGAGGTTTRTKNHNRRNQITSISGQTAPTYDANGNMLSDEQGHTFKYDAWDRLVAEGVGVENVRYTYDARGYRTERIVAGVSTYFYYDLDWQLVEERLIAGGNGGGGTPTIATYVWGEGYVDSLVARDHAVNGRQYAQQDANFNVTSLTNSAGTVQERYVYDPYGAVTYKTGTWGDLGGSGYAWQYLHHGGRLDTTTNLYHFRHRDCSAALGRWVSTDPLGYADGINLYEAWRSSPVTLSDWDGLDAGAPRSGIDPYGGVPYQSHSEFEDWWRRLPYNPDPGPGYDPKMQCYALPPQTKKYGKLLGYGGGVIVASHMGATSHPFVGVLAGLCFKQIVDDAYDEPEPPSPEQPPVP